MHQDINDELTVLLVKLILFSIVQRLKAILGSPRLQAVRINATQGLMNLFILQMELNGVE